MTTNSKPRSIAQITQAISKGKITFDNYLQRKAGQWSPSQKSKLIDSVLRGYPIPPVYAIVPSAGEESIIDGCQRLNTIAEFVNNKFSLSADTKPVYPKGMPAQPISKKKFKNLPEELRDTILNTDITIITLTDYTADELVEIFDRLNGGTALSPAQKSKVYMNFDFAAIIARIADKPVFTKVLTDKQIKRDLNQEVVEQALMLMLADIYPFSGFGAVNTKKFLKQITPDYKAYMDRMSALADIFDVMDTLIPEDCKTVTKAMLPPMALALRPIYQDNKKVDAFKKNLDKFLVDPTSDAEYMKYASLHTTAKENVEGRTAFFEAMAK